MGAAVLDTWFPVTWPEAGSKSAGILSVIFKGSSLLLSIVAWLLGEATIPAAH